MAEASSMDDFMMKRGREELIERLKALPIMDRIAVASDAGISIACCPGCGCYIGADYCHPAEDAVEWEAYGECKSRCSEAGDDEYESHGGDCESCGEVIDSEDPQVVVCPDCADEIAQDMAQGGA